MQYIVDQATSKVDTEDILITIRERPARAIFDKQKKYELRKVLPRTIPRRMFLYEAGNTRAVTGHIVLGKVLAGRPEDLWESLGETASTKERFFAYFDDARVGYAFEIVDACEYSEPISKTDIKQVEAGFLVPQNFLYLSNLPKCANLLYRRAFDESILGVDPQEGIDFQRLAKENEERFVEEVGQHIGGTYLETGVAYGRKLIEVAKRDYDPEGIFTISKHILDIYKEGVLCGFIVITEKKGGAIKTGPTILFRYARQRHYGRKIRRRLHNGARVAGIRKVYCTAPFSNEAAFKYLIASGYQIEAHLKLQYHTNHDEFVFGYLVAAAETQEVSYSRAVEPVDQFNVAEKDDPEVAMVLKEEMKNIFMEVSEQWVIEQLGASTRTLLRIEGEGKPRVIFSGRNTAVKCVALCSAKRGGSVKIVLLTKTAHRKSLIRFLSYIEENMRQLFPGVRKFYATVPTGDIDVGAAFCSRGYEKEGVLRRPYNSICDFHIWSYRVENRQDFGEMAAV